MRHLLTITLFGLISSLMSCGGGGSGGSGGSGSGGGGNPTPSVDLPVLSRDTSNVVRNEDGTNETGTANYSYRGVDWGSYDYTLRRTSGNELINYSEVYRDVISGASGTLEIQRGTTPIINFGNPNFNEGAFQRLTGVLTYQGYNTGLIRAVGVGLDEIIPGEGSFRITFNMDDNTGRLDAYSEVTDDIRLDVNGTIGFNESNGRIFGEPSIKVKFREFEDTATGQLTGNILGSGEGITGSYNDLIVLDNGSLAIYGMMVGHRAE